VTRFTYKVIVDVPDDSLRPDNKDVVECWSMDEEFDDETGEGKGTFSPETLSRIVLSERLGCDEDYGFYYRVDWDGPLDPHI
jgi:hypothetical protein